jgi:hypothetical protein
VRQWVWDQECVALQKSLTMFGRKRNVFFCRWRTAGRSRSLHGLVKLHLPDQGYAIALARIHSAQTETFDTP